MQKINFRKIIKITNAVLGVIIVANFIYFLFAVVREIRQKQSITLSPEKITDISGLFSEIEKNSDKIKDLLK